MVSEMRLDGVLTALKALYPAKIDLSLDRMLRLLDRLGNPQDSLPPVFHVAGTNGKGSTVATLRAILEAQGHSCHVYTSPHLIRFNERIRLAGVLIDDETLIAFVNETAAANDGAPITFFEITTVAAFLAFSRVPADALLLEVGLGGRLDATNVISDPLVSIITTMSCDHREWLGQTLPAIATEKAGIIKPGAPCVIGHQLGWAQNDVMPVFRRRAQECRTALLCCGDEWLVDSSPGAMEFSMNGETIDLPRPSLPGDHQVWNAGNAIAALKAQKRLVVGDDAIRRGIANIEWPARMERIASGPVARTLPSGWELWYDGAHNDSGGQVLAHTLDQWSRDGGGPVHLVCGMLKSRKAHEFLEPVVPHIASLTTFTFHVGAYAETSPARDGAGLAEEIKGIYPEVSFGGDLAEAVSGVPSKHTAPGRIVVAGTLYAYKDLFA